MEEKNTFIHTIRNILGSKYDFRFNVVKYDIEYSLKGKNAWSHLEKRGQLFVDICENEEKGRFNVTSISQLLDSEFVKEYHPFKEYFKGLGDWDGQDYIREYCNYVDTIDKEDFYTQFKKWLTRTVKTAIEPKYFNKQAFVIVNSKQNTGKTSWCRFLVPSSLSDYITEHFDTSKDGRIAMCRNLLINLDELEGWTRKDIAAFKSALSAEAIHERLPYARNASFLVRTCSFIGSTNQKDFINDETGSVRWLCFDVKSINFDYRKNCQIDKIWQQAYHLSQSDDFNCEMTIEELNKNEIRNQSFSRISVEEDVIRKYYEKGTEMFETATEILCNLKNKDNVQLSPVYIGRALGKLGFERKKYKGVFGYWVKKK
jgi:predicted P-loop ATPase